MQTPIITMHMKIRAALKFQRIKMALFKSMVTPNGIPTTYHKIVRAELLGNEDQLRIQVGSWPTEETYVSGAPAAWITNTAVSSGNLYNTIQTQLLESTEFIDSTVLAEADLLTETKQRRWLSVKGAQKQQEYSGLEFEMAVYKSDLESQNKIQMAVISALQDPGYSAVLDLVNGTTKELSSQKLIELNQALVTQVETLHTRAQSLRLQIDAATTVEAVNQITW